MNDSYRPFLGAPKPKCSAGDCPRDAVAKGLCHGHYRRQHRAAKGEGRQDGRPVDMEKPIGFRDVVELTGTRVPEPVAAVFAAMAEAQGVTQYEFMRMLVMDWYAKVVPNASSK